MIFIYFQIFRYRSRYRYRLQYIYILHAPQGATNCRARFAKSSNLSSTAAVFMPQVASKKGMGKDEIPIQSQCGAPVNEIAKLVHITSITLVYDTYNHSIHWVYKPTYNWGGNIARHMDIKLIKPMKYQKNIHILGMMI